MKELDELLMKTYNIADLVKLKMKVINGDSQTKQQDLEEIEKEIVSYAKYISEEEYSRQEAMGKVAYLVKELIGERTPRRAALEAGVAVSYFNGILNGKYLPSASIIKKIADHLTTPQTNVTLQDLMIAAGYQNDYQNNHYENYSDRFDSEGTNFTLDTFIGSSECPNTTEDESKRKSYEYMAARRNKERAMAGIIYKSMAEKGIIFRSENNLTYIKRYHTDMAVYVNQEPINEWFFKFYSHCASDLNLRQIIHFAKDVMCHFMLLEPCNNHKVSFVVCDQEVYDALSACKNKLSFRGDLSLILVNPDSFRVVDEIYLSHYNESSTDSEFYII